MGIKIQGTISSGFGEAAYFTQLDWVVNEFLTKFGFVPYPGTLNLDVTNEDWKCLVRWFGRNGGVTIAPPDRACCSAICFKAQIDGCIEAALIMPEVTKHSAGKLEIVAPVKVKDTLRLKDGDKVTLTLKK